MQLKTLETQTTVIASLSENPTLDVSISETKSPQADGQNVQGLGESALEAVNQEREYYIKLVGVEKKPQSWGRLLLGILVIYCSTFSVLGILVTLTFPRFLNCGGQVQESEGKPSLAALQRTQSVLSVKTVPISP